MSKTSAEIAERELRLDQAAAKYLELLAAGQPVDREQFLHPYGELAVELAEFLDDLDRLNQAQTPTGQFEAMPHSSNALISSAMNSPVALDNSVRHLLGAHTSSTRYHLDRFLARGGMGEVWSADDAHVGRRIAVKRILNAAHSGSIAEERFLFESQIMGQLEHPCIVPLHDLCRDELGDLFSVMRLVNGCSFKERLGKFHAERSDTNWPRDVEFLRLLEAFVSICQAVAYAHSRGVLHRDIKPDNIMLGSYGEALLLDWGLAKLIDQVEPRAAVTTGCEPVRLSPGVSTATRAGTIMGSSAYMPPEIAAGRADAADERTDVYLLGATLYELLTNRPPRTGSSQLELITLAQSTPPSPPRRIDAQIPKSLEAICLRAMAHQSEQRYESASALAEEIQRYLAREPVKAYCEPVLVRLWRWCRRHRHAIQRVSVVAILIVLCGLAGFSYRRAQELQAKEAARTQLAAFRRLADDAQFFAANTDAIMEHAPYYSPQRAIQKGTAALELAAAWGEHASELPIGEQRAAVVTELYDLLLMLANHRQSLASTAFDQSVALQLLDQAATLRPASRAFYQIRSRCLRQMGHAEEADREAARATTTTQLTAQDWFLEGEWERAAAAQSVSPVSGIPKQALEPVVRAIVAYERALQLDPQHYWAHFQLARCYLRTQRGPEAVAALGACIALRPESPWAYSTRGLIHGLLGQFSEADRDFSQALQLDPQFRVAYLNRGFVRSLQNRQAEALSDLDAVLRPPHESVLIEAAFYRAQIHCLRGELSNAMRDCDLFLSDRPGFAPAHALAAQIHFRQGDEALGLQCVDAMLACGSPGISIPAEIVQAIARGRALRALAMGLDTASQQRVLQLALREFESVRGPEAEQDVAAVQDLLGLAEEVVKKYSQRLASTPEDATTRKLRGWNYVTLKRYELAANDFATAIDLAHDDAEAHAGLGYVLALQGDRAAAELEANKSVMHGSEAFLVLHNVACIYAELAHANIQQRTAYEDLALAFLERAVVLARQHPSGIEESECIRNEAAFHESLRARPEFMRLLSGRTQP